VPTPLRATGNRWLRQVSGGRVVAGKAAGGRRPGLDVERGPAAVHRSTHRVVDQRVRGTRLMPPGVLVLDAGPLNHFARAGHLATLALTTPDSCRELVLGALGGHSPPGGHRQAPSGVDNGPNTRHSWCDLRRFFVIHRGGCLYRQGSLGLWPGGGVPPVNVEVLICRRISCASTEDVSVGVAGQGDPSGGGVV
jgi:hypothetical protein